MCHKVIYNYKDKQHTVSFDDAFAKLPVLLRNGHIKLFPWGRHKKSQSPLPMGGIVNLNEIQLGKWDAYFPKPVKLPIKAFLVRDIEDHAKWFHLPSDKWIQGMMVNEGTDIRLYIVTLSPHEDSVYPHWPRVLLG